MKTDCVVANLRENSKVYLFQNNMYTVQAPGKWTRLVPELAWQANVSGIILISLSFLFK